MIPAALEPYAIPLEACPNPVLVVQTGGDIVYCNRQCEELFLYERGELLKQKVEVLMHQRFRDQHPLDREVYCQKPVTRAMGSGRELFALKKDGTEFPVEIGLNPFVSMGETYIMASLIDISERKKAEARIKKSSEQLKESNAELEEFAFIASHDLKEPIRGIRGFSKIILEDHGEELSPQAVDYLKAIGAMAKRGEEQINTLLRYSRIGQQNLRLQRESPKRLVLKVLKSLKHLQQEKQVKISVLEPWPEFLICDQILTEKVFQNLVANALKFAASHEPCIEIGHENVGTLEHPHGYFFVRDNGLGIDSKYHKVIFDIFRQVESSSEKTQVGEGLGLAIVKKIIDRHHGSIRLESKLGEGCTFRFHYGSDLKSEPY